MTNFAVKGVGNYNGGYNPYDVHVDGHVPIPEKRSSAPTVGIIAGLATAATAVYLVKSGKGKQALDASKKFFTEGKGKTAWDSSKGFFTEGKGKQALDASKKFFTEGKGKTAWEAIKGFFKKAPKPQTPPAPTPPAV